jgi:two-component sensor histidine kinase
MVVSLSMVLHELATNAAKYGSLSVPGGKILLEWSVLKEDGYERLAMRWEESGGPEVTPPVRKGFGTRLLERQFAMEFSGSVALDHHPGGLVCAMNLRLPPASSAEHEALKNAFGSAA